VPANDATTFGAEVAVVQSLLSEIPSSHLGLTSATAYRSLMRAVSTEREPMFGLQLMRWDGRWFAASVLQGGPAYRAGIRAWDEILDIDGAPPDSSPRLDMRSDDAFLPDDRDPPLHGLIAGPLSVAEFRVRKSVDSTISIEIAAEQYSAWDGTIASVRVIERDSLRIGYIRLYFMYDAGSAWFSDLFTNQWAGVDAVILDLRGRGGSGALAYSIAAMLGVGRERRFAGPVVALQDRQTRSAKEMLAHMIRARSIGILIGEPTAGAVLEVRSLPVGNDLTLMLPVRRGGFEWAKLERHPVPPDVAVAWGGPLSSAADPIFDAGVQEIVRIAARDGRGVIVPRAVSDPKLRNARP
jgi:C-terminal processing protease CtpA/Prc